MGTATWGLVHTVLQGRVAQVASVISIEKAPPCYPANLACILLAINAVAPEQGLYIYYCPSVATAS